MKPFIHYLITDPERYSNNINQFEKTLKKAIDSHVIDFICFRDKQTKDIEPLAKVCVEMARRYNKKVLINSNIELAIKLKANGVHLRSDQFELIPVALKNDLLVVVSCHTQEEINLAQNYRAHIVTYSPVFTSPNKGTPLGIENFTQVVNSNTIPIIALGGIVSKQQVQQIQQTKAIGFASIRYFI